MESNDAARLGALLFLSAEDAEGVLARYPERTLPEGAAVTRFAPSPTGFVHIGGLFSALISERIAHQSGGVFFLRIEDTDKKREIEDGVRGIVEALEGFGFRIDEGVAADGSERGAYGPYLQSARLPIYHAFARELVARGHAYPCFCTEEELAATRTEQERLKQKAGYHGQWARHRHATLDETRADLDAGRPFVLRIRSQGGGKIRVDDRIKGALQLPENDLDAVLIKSDGYPTYHFAHVVDDHLMGTTHVVRGDEWLPSVPLHLQLFDAFDWERPAFAHIPTILKMDGASKRKLSKRKDPEASVRWYVEEGFPAQSVIEYLLTLANSAFEDWRRANADAAPDAYVLKTEKINNSGALFDLVKLTDVSKGVISRMPAAELYRLALAWADEFDTELAGWMRADEPYMLSIFDVERDQKGRRKDLAKWSELKESVRYFFDAPYAALTHDWPENVPADARRAIIDAFLARYDTSLDRDAWFADVKTMARSLGYADDMKAYKADPASFKGSVADVATVLRVALTGRRQTPDLHGVMRVLGEARVRSRLGTAR